MFSDVCVCVMYAYVYVLPPFPSKEGNYGGFASAMESGIMRATGAGGGEWGLSCQWRHHHLMGAVQFTWRRGPTPLEGRPAIDEMNP